MRSFLVARMFYYVIGGHSVSMWCKLNFRVINFRRSFFAFSACFFSLTLPAPTLAVIRWRNGAVVGADTKCSFLSSDTIARGNIKRNKSVNRQKVVHKKNVLPHFLFSQFRPLFCCCLSWCVSQSALSGRFCFILYFVLLPNMYTSINGNHWIEQKRKYFHLKLFFYCQFVFGKSKVSFFFTRFMPCPTYDKRQIGEETEINIQFQRWPMNVRRKCLTQFEIWNESTQPIYLAASEKNEFHFSRLIKMRFTSIFCMFPRVAKW